ncbi:MAG: response regulator [Candidatus Omnitrophica bacterium]|nr:response regulator [Candidatus Omnitrophota bacterium]
MPKDIKIILVDDEPDFTRPMTFWFESKGYKVIVASDAESAIKLTKEQSPDIVFLDLNIPGSDGIAILKKIREFNKDIPVIIISAYVDRLKVKEVELYGVSGVFYKGDNFDKGLFLLESVLNKQKKPRNG